MFPAHTPYPASPQAETTPGKGSCSGFFVKAGTAIRRAVESVVAAQPRLIMRWLITARTFPRGHHGPGLPRPPRQLPGCVLVSLVLSLVVVVAE